MSKVINYTQAEGPPVQGEDNVSYFCTDTGIWSSWDSEKSRYRLVSLGQAADIPPYEVQRIILTIACTHIIDKLTTYYNLLNKAGQHNQNNYLLRNSVSIFRCLHADFMTAKKEEELANIMPKLETFIARFFQTHPQIFL